MQFISACKATVLRRRKLIPQNAVRIMKLTVVILMAGFLTASATGNSQRLSLSVKEAPVQRVFADIEKQSGYYFTYNIELLRDAKPVSMEVKNASIENVLDLCVKNQPFTYLIIGHLIVLKEPISSTKLFEVKYVFGEVRGKVVTSDGDPVVGANVAEIGPNNRNAITDIEGNFALEGINDNAIILISHVQFETERVKINGQRFIKVTLHVKINNLDETQVIAYGITSKRFNTGNISSIKSTDIEKQPVNNPLLALTGRVPGLFVTQNTGVPGGGVTVRIQGQNSIRSGNDPFYVIDGVPYTSQLLSTTTGAGGILGNSGGPSGSGAGNPLNYISLDDIESIEVLKDADATAIYGSRAANGAILITTKKGKIGAAQININIQSGLGQVANDIDLMDTQQYIEMRNEGLKNNNLIPNPSSDYDLTLWDTSRFTDWQKELVGNTASYTNVNASFSGGSTNSQYFIGSTYHRESSVFPGKFSDKKSSVHLSLNSTSTNHKFNLQLSSSYLYDNNQLPFGDLTPTAIVTPPNAPQLYNDDGSLNWALNSSGSSTWTNPLVALFNTYENRTSNIISNAVLSYKVFKGFDIKTSLGYTDLTVNELQTIPLGAFAPETRSNAIRTAYYSSSKISSWILEPQLSYTNVFGKSRIELLAGGTFQHKKSSGQNLRGTGYNSDAVLKDIRSASTVVVNSSNEALYKYNAAFGRLKYIFKDKYIINITARRDGSSRFGEQNQFHNFASIGGAWVFTQENLIKRHIPFLSFGKIKASYGTTGNDQIGDYLFMNLYSVANTDVPYQNTASLTVNGLPNPYLQWEETKKLQLGLEAGFFSDRIFLSTSYSRNRSSNQLLFYLLPSITGFSAILENFPATVQNTSFELSINSKNIKTNVFNWTSAFNLTVPQNKLVDFPNLETSIYKSIYIIGQPISVLRGFMFSGVDPVTGQYQFFDSQGNVTFSPSPTNDRNAMINILPKFYGGLENTINYRNFQVSLLLQFVKQLGPNIKFGGGLPPGTPFNQPKSVLSRWQKAGDMTDVQKYSSNFNLFSSLNFAKSSNAFYSDASYIRLKNLSFSYQLSERVRKNIRLKNCKFYINAQNLFTITKFMGMDPENMNLQSLPPLRVITVGLQLTI